MTSQRRNNMAHYRHSHNAVLEQNSGFLSQYQSNALWDTRYNARLFYRDFLSQQTHVPGISEIIHSHCTFLCTAYKTLITDKTHAIHCTVIG